MRNSSDICSIHVYARRLAFSNASPLKNDQQLFFATKKCFQFRDSVLLGRHACNYLSPLLRLRRQINSNSFSSSRNTTTRCPRLAAPGSPRPGFQRRRQWHRSRKAVQAEAEPAGRGDPPRRWVCVPIPAFLDWRSHEKRCSIRAGTSAASSPVGFYFMRFFSCL